MITWILTHNVWSQTLSESLSSLQSKAFGFIRLIEIRRNGFEASIFDQDGYIVPAAEIQAAYYQYFYGQAQ